MLQGTQWDVAEARQILTDLDAAIESRRDGVATPQGAGPSPGPSLRRAHEA